MIRVRERLFAALWSNRHLADIRVVLGDVCLGVKRTCRGHAPNVRF